ncbi:hypothetical protein GCM10009111_10480 [Colwellia asteriadis]|uniref:Uncharacterized protein n=1 Tax=Colwellia asteriadis TaxID=517723 RepID=A0ABN1L4V0_9GAMM
MTNNIGSTISKAANTLNNRLNDNKAMELRIHRQSTRVDNELTPSSVVAGVQVMISEQGQRQLTQEQVPADKVELGKAIAKQLNQQASDSLEQSAEPDDPLEKLIAELKEKIEEIMRELTKLLNDDTTTAQEQAKQLSQELIELNGQLLALMEQKLEQAKTG